MQWAILSLRIICDCNQENQAIIAGLSKQGVIKPDALQELGLTSCTNNGCFYALSWNCIGDILDALENAAFGWKLIAVYSAWSLETLDGASGHLWCLFCGINSLVWKMQIFKENALLDRDTHCRIQLRIMN
ncbi:hypothetical protein HUJ05_012396 [Dendroctonus ponderosae]|nr:hypothetical protein HUJ05_012396 [Dendroctonus ponderosae]